MTAKRSIVFYLIPIVILIFFSSSLPLSFASTSVENNVFTHSSTPVKLLYNESSNGYNYFGGTTRLLFGDTSTGLSAVVLKSGDTKWAKDYHLTIRSAALGNGLIFVGTEQGKVFAVNETTGRVAWSFAAASTTTLIFGGGEVFANSIAGYLYALNASTGVLLWSSTDIQGTSSAPAFSNGVVYDNSATGEEVFAFNATNGNLIWMSSNLGGESVSSPIVGPSGEHVYEGTSSGWVYALNSSDGALIWSYNTGVDTYAVLAQRGVLLAANSAFTTLYAFNATTGSEIWSAQQVQSFSVTTSNRLAVLTSDGVINSSDIRTGVSQWQYGPDTYSSGVAPFKTQTLFVTTDNVLHGLSSKSGSQQFTLPLPGSTSGTYKMLTEGKYLVVTTLSQLYVLT